MTNNLLSANRTYQILVRAAIILCSSTLILNHSSRADAASFTLHHEATMSFDFGGERMPQWIGGALVNFVSNPSASPVLLSFDEEGKQLQTLSFTVPGSEKVNLFDIARGPNGAMVVCGTAYDKTGRGAGFFAVLAASGEATIVRLHPYYPFRIAAASDGTIWVAGVEIINGKQTGPGINPADGVVRHFDASGKQLGSFVPMSSLSVPYMAEYGRIRAANDRIGWYTGPIAGPGSLYYEILSDGTVFKYPSISLNKTERVTGLALTDDGATYVTTFDNIAKVNRLLSTTASTRQWKTESLPDRLAKAFLYGAQGNRLVFNSRDRLKMTFVDVTK